MPNRLRVLIVEDDADASENLRDILSLDDHQVTLESAAKSALVRAKSGTWDVVILDRNLPDGVADELIPAFKSALPMSEVIVVTGYADLDGTIAALRAGAADYIIKPINPDALRASLIRIAQKRRTEKELREERQFAQTILETAEAIILVLNTHGRIVRFNPYLAELTGYSLEEVADHDWFETFIPEEDRPRIRDVFERTVQQLESRGIINPILTKTGQTCDIRWSNTVLKDMDGKVTGVLTVGLDITDLITAQKRLLQAERLAAIGQTMAGLAHESRNALQRVQNSVELLELELEDHPQALADLAKINRASNDLRDLLEEVRQYAAPIHLEKTPSNIQQVWRSAWESLHVRRQGRDVRFHDRMDKSPAATNIDTRRMEQLFRNLFENALDACHDPVEIGVECECQSDALRILVRDNGPGMQSSEKDHAFEAFFTTKATGTGLGLAIVKRIIDAHNGSICISNSPTQFEIRLPIA